MWISNFAIRNPVITVVMMLALAVFGAVSLFTLDTDEFPEVNPPVISVQIPYPGASPQTVERELVVPLEEAFASISGLDQLDSTSLDGFALLTVTFDYDKNLQEASQDIRDKISEIRPDLPKEMEEPLLTRFDPNDFPIVSLTLSSPTASVAELSRLVDPGLTGQLRGLPGVAEVTPVGNFERELTVELDPDALQASGVGVAEVVQALEAQNLAAPVGRVSTLLDERTLRLQGRLERPADFAEVVVSRSGAQLVRLGEVATLRDGHEEPRSLALFNGDPAVGIDVKKATNASTTAVSERVRQKVESLRKTLPREVNLRIVRDSGVRVERSVEDVERTLVEGALLTVAVVFLFLNSWRSTVITGLALPVSVLASFIAVKAFGFTLNTMSLLGLSLAIGILVDDAIVVRENIVRHMEMGKGHALAAQEGTSEIGLAVAATTFAIVVVFVPIAFMGGIAQQWFAPFALTIACSVLVSLFVSFSLDPMLSAVWADPALDPNAPRGWLGRAVGRFNHAFDRQTERYKRVIGWALDHRGVMLLVAVAAFLGALAIPALGVVGSEFLPEQDNSEFTVALETPPGSSLEYTRRKVEEVVRSVREEPEVAYTYSTVGGQGDVVEEGSVYVRLVPKKERQRSQHRIAAEVRKRVQRIVGVTASITTQRFAAQKQIQLQLLGPNLEVLDRLAEQAAQEVQQVRGAVDVGLSTRGRRPELEVTVDRDLAASVGVSVGQVAQALRPAFAGLDSGDWVDPDGETRDVMVRFRPSARTNAADLERVPLVLGDKVVPLGQVARVRKSMGPSTIEHLDRERVIAVEANTQGRPLTQVMQDISRRLERVSLPSGYRWQKGGESEDQAEVFGRILLALGVAVTLMYLILVMQFTSFLDPLPILASLPLSLIGVMVALWVTGSTLNLMSMIGVILLMGIVAKNAILLIDFAKWTHAKGVGRHAALIEAGGVRLRPILMTSIAIIAGMFPVALGLGEGADFRAPLGRAVIGGVITSTLLTLLVIPTFYDMLADFRDRVRRGVRQRGKGFRVRPSLPGVEVPGALPSPRSSPD